MKSDTKVTAMIPAHDVERAVRWYEEKLGFKPARNDDYGATYAFNGLSAFLYKSDYAGTAEHTLLSFDTSNLAADMTALRGRGVVFLDYDLPDLKTENGVAVFGPVKNAWAKDSEGNILGFVEGM
ncbi:VOC family protein [Devosia sp. CN2-171]|uniref:VOC family protein n=1 Tax=Devosia sp. CN2-171 TaxID=3400909 RepID=UPI003BF77AD6